MVEHGDLGRRRRADELAALDALGGKAASGTLGGHDAAADQPRQGAVPRRRGRDRAVTKRDLIRYHASIAPAMLPYLADRPVNLNRFPDGVDKPGFWHKAVPTHAPDWLPRWHNADAGPGETQEYLVLDSPAALAWAGQLRRGRAAPVDVDDRDTRTSRRGR